MQESLYVSENEKQLLFEYVTERTQTNSKLVKPLWLLILLDIVFFLGNISDLIAISPALIGIILMLILIILATMETTYQRKIILKIDIDFITLKFQSNYKSKFTEIAFSNKEVLRIYVKQNTKNKDVLKDYFHEIWIEKKNGQKKRLIGQEEGFLGKNPKESYILTGRTSDFLAKINGLKSKEKIKNIVPPTISPRQITKEQNPRKLKIKDLREGILLDFHNQTWEVIGQIQYDWKLKNTDMLYQIKNGKNETNFLFVAQNIAIYTIWTEERLTQHSLMSHKLDKIARDLPLEFHFEDSLFLKEHFNVGYEFVSNENEGTKIKQWKYISEDGKESLRILQHEDEDIFVFSGTKVEEFEFSNILIP